MTVPESIPIRVLHHTHPDGDHRVVFRPKPPQLTRWVHRLRRLRIVAGQLGASRPMRIAVKEAGDCANADPTLARRSREEEEEIQRERGMGEEKPYLSLLSWNADSGGEARSPP